MDITIKNGQIMLSDFNALQAYKIARKLEKDGIDFYSKILDESSDKELNSALRYLIASEKDHLDFFQSRITDMQAEAVDGFEEEDLIDFVDSTIFIQEELDQRENIDFTQPASALSYGVIVEAKSVAFYTALRENVHDGAAQTALSEIIAEEKKHLATLRSLV
jgi:rubrerythrin